MEKEKKRLLEKLNNNDDLLDRLIEELEACDPDLLAQSPGPGKWSVLQIMQHLIIAERASLGYVRKKTSHTSVFKKKTIRTQLRSWTLNTFQSLPLKFKAPKSADPQTLPADVTLNEVVLLWRSVRRELRSFIEFIDPALLDREVYKHPYAGRMTLLQMVTFFENHFKRHRKQIRRILGGTAI